MPDLPEAIDDLLVRALDAEPSRRHGSADELAAELAASGLTWSGSFRLDRDHSIPPTLEDPTVNPDEPATHVDRA